MYLFKVNSKRIQMNQIWFLQNVLGFQIVFRKYLSLLKAEVVEHVLRLRNLNPVD